MASCGGCATRAGRGSYVHTAANGTTRVYSTETEAKAAVVRHGGTYKPQ